MKRINKFLSAVLISTAFMICGIFGFHKENITANAAAEITSGAEFNTEIKNLETVSGGLITAIEFATEDEYNSAPTTKVELSIADIFETEVFYSTFIWISDSIMYYYSPDSIYGDGTIVLEDFSGLFSGLVGVKTIDLSGFDMTFVSNIDSMFTNCSSLENVDLSQIYIDSATNLFSGCTSLNTVTLGYGSKGLFSSLEEIWNVVYDSETKSQVASATIAKDGDTQTFEKANATVNIRLDYRDGNGFIESTDASYTFNPSKEGFEFYGWASEIDSWSIVDKSNGTHSTEYDIEDFAESGDFYAVWKKNGNICVSKPLDFTTMDSFGVGSTYDYGYEWNKDTKELLLDGLYMWDFSDSAYCILLPEGSSVSYNDENASNTIISSIAGKVAIKCGSLTINNISITINCGKVIESTGDLYINGCDIFATGITSTAINLTGKFRLNTGKFIIHSDYNEIIKASGNVSIIEAEEFNISSKTHSAISSEGVVSVSGGFVKIATMNTSSITASSVEFLDVCFKTGDDESTSQFVNNYNYEKFVISECHDFEYAVDSGHTTLTATCKNNFCLLSDNKVTVTIGAFDSLYSDQEINVNVTNKNNFEYHVKTTLSIIYSGILSTEYEDSLTAPINAGDYRATITFKPAIDAETYQIYADFKISKINYNAVPEPKTNNALVYSGAEFPLADLSSCSIDGTYVFKVDGGTYSETIPTAVNANTYRVYYKVIGDANHNDSSENYFDITISPKTIEIIWAEDDFTYSGDTQTITAKYLDVNLEPVNLKVEVDREFKDVGEYDAEVSFLNNETNYEINIVDKIKKYNIKKLKLNKPTADSTNFVYTGNELTYNIAVDNHYEVSGNKKTEIGTHIVTVSLKDKINTCWSDNTTADLTYDFVINAAVDSNPTPTENTTNNNPKKGNSLPWIIGGGVVAITAVAGAIFIVLKKKKETK